MWTDTQMILAILGGVFFGAMGGFLLSAMFGSCKMADLEASASYWRERASELQSRLSALGAGKEAKE